MELAIDGAVPKNRVLCGPRTAASGIAGTFGCCFFLFRPMRKLTHVFTLQTRRAVNVSWLIDKKSKGKYSLGPVFRFFVRLWPRIVISVHP